MESKVVKGAVERIYNLFPQDTTLWICPSGTPLKSLFFVEIRLRYRFLVLGRQTGEGPVPIRAAWDQNGANEGFPVR